MSASALVSRHAESLVILGLICRLLLQNVIGNYGGTVKNGFSNQRRMLLLPWSNLSVAHRKRIAPPISRCRHSGVINVRPPEIERRRTREPVRAGIVLIK
jgi:hypothetical protein